MPNQGRFKFDKNMDFIFFNFDNLNEVLCSVFVVN